MDECVFTVYVFTLMLSHLHNVIIRMAMHKFRKIYKSRTLK